MAISVEIVRAARGLKSDLVKSKEYHESLVLVRLETMDLGVS